MVAVLMLAASVLAAPPSGFQNQHVGSFDGTPISILFLPDGRLLVAEKEGMVYLGDPLAQPFAPVPVLAITNLATEFERGLLDFTLDPAFETNGHVFVYYSAAVPARFRVSRFTFDPLTSTIDPASEVVVWEDHLDHDACCHYGGGIDFGPDGMLYVTMGDETFGFPAEDLGDTAGSVLRLASDGSIPADNPFVGVEGARPEIWMRGLRNPFRARWDLETERLFIGEVGGNDQQIAFEELNLATPASAGGHFGWPKCEGPAGNPDFPLCDGSIHTDPVFSYPHAGFGAAIVAGEVYRGDLFPAEYDEVFFYGDYTRRYIRYLTFDATGLVVTGDFEFEPSTSFVISITLGPDGALYYAELNGDLRRITYVDQVPQVSCGVDVAVGPPPHTVELTCTLGDDQDALLDFHADFGDGATLDLPAQPVGSPIVVQHTYTTKGLYAARGEATDSVANIGVSDPVEVGVGYPPDVVITGCEEGDLFRARDVITCHAVVVDPDATGGPEDPVADDVQWTVRFLHNEHTHPAATGSGAWLTFEIPHQEHDFRDDTGFEITARVTDADGLEGEDRVTIWPDKVDVTFATDPPGLTLSLDGLPVQGPFVLDTLIFFEHLVVAADQCFVGTQYRFDGWSDGGGAGHVVVVPDTDTTLTASFSAEGSCVPTGGKVLHLDPAEGVVTDGADRVVSWSDLSPQGNDVMGLGDGPTRVTDGLEFRPTLRFDGVDDALGRDGLSSFPLGNGDRSLFWVVRYDGDGTGGLAYGQPAPNQTFGLVVSPGDGKLTLQGWGLANDYKSTSPGEGDPWLIQGVIVDDGNFYHYRDGALIDSGTHVWSTSGDLLRIGVEIDGSPHIAMEVAEILVYDRALSRTSPGPEGDSEVAQVETYFRQKYFPVEIGAPKAGDDWGAIPPGGTITIDLLANDHDPDGDGHLHGADVTLLTTPAVGTWHLDSVTGELTYTHDGESPLPGESVELTYQVADHQGLLSNEAKVTLPVLGAAFPDLPGRVLHLRADLGVATDDSTGDSLATLWGDLSGHGHEVEASGGPRLRTDGPTGGRYIAFDGVDERFESHGHLHLPAGNDDRTVFVVIRHHDEAFGGLAWGTAGTDCALDGNRVFGLVTDNHGRLAVQGWCQHNDFVTPVVGNGAGWMVHGARLENGVLTQTRNGQPIGAWDHGFDTDPEGHLMLGAEIDGAPHAALDLAAVLVYDRALAPAELEAVEAWLRATWVGDSEPPVANDDLVAVAPGGSVTLDLPANDTDDGLIDRGSVTLGTMPTLGTVDPPSEGLVTYTADAGAAPGIVDTFTYTVADGAGNGSNVATVQVVIDDPLLPADGLVLRLEVDHGLDLEPAEVRRWSDLSGRGFDLAPPSGVDGPLRRVGSGPRGGDFLAFDGGWLESTGLGSLPTAAADRSVFLVARYRGAGFGGLAWGAPGLCSQGEGNGVFGSVVDGQGRLTVQGWCAENDFPSSEVGTGSGWSSHGIEVSVGTVSHYRDGQLINGFVHDFATAAQGRLVLGAEIDGDPAVAMDVAAVLVYDRVLSTGERHAVETYLHARYLTDDFVNPPPTVVDDSASVVPWGCVAIAVLGNDSDDSGLAPATVVASPPTSNPAADPLLSTVAVDPMTGIVTYCANAPQLVDTFTYTVADTTGAVSSPATVAVVLDDPPPINGGLLLHLETAFGAVVSDPFGVVGWLDRTGFGHDLVAIGSPQKIEGELAGHPVLRFGASGARLVNGGSIAALPSGNADRTLVVLVRYRGAGFGGVAWGWPVCNRVFGLVVDDQGDLAVQGWCSDFRSSEVGAGAGWRVQTATLDTGTLTHTRDGVVIGTAQHVFETQANGQLVVGAEIDGSPAVDMDVAAVLIYDRALSNVERQALEAWLASRYGLP